MIPSLFHDLRLSSSITASTTGAGGDPSLVLRSAIRACWITTGYVANPEFIQMDLTSNVSLMGVFVQHCTMPNPSLLADTANPPTTSRATWNAANEPGAAFAATVASPSKGGIDRHGIARLRGINYNANGVPQAFTARYIRISDNNTAVALRSYPNAASAPYYVIPSQRDFAYEVGSIYAFTAVRPFPSKPLNGARVTYVYPREVTQLRNGRVAVVDLGAPYCEIEMDFVVARTPNTAYGTLVGAPVGFEDLESLTRIASEGVCWLDLGIADKPWLSWPVRYVETEQLRRHRVAGDRHDLVTLRFREVT